MNNPSGSGTWVVAGAPLEGGAGWRIWYSRKGTGEFLPREVVVRRGGVRESVSPSWPLGQGDPSWYPLGPADGLDRRMGVLTVMLDHPAAGARYELAIPEAGAPVTWQSLPDDLDGLPDPDPRSTDGVTFLFASCFWRNNDVEGAYASGVAELIKRWRPAFKLLIGDQVYQDWPWSFTLTESAGEKYAGRYEQYWGDPTYRELLRSTPNFFLCDDHEFWNNYPERQIQLPRTWTKGGRDAHGLAAHETYQRFQGCLNPGTAPWYRFRVGPVSFFVSDTRSERDPVDESHPTPRFLQEPQWADLEAWVRGLDGPGVLVLGQPMYAHSGGKKDRTLPDFSGDYARLAALIESSLRGADGRPPHDVLMLSGDIHVGRYAFGRVPGVTPAAEVHELIASAASRIAPDMKTPTPHEAPTKLPLPPDGQTKPWEVTTLMTPPMPTIDNNVGLVRMSSGTRAPTGQERVRFQMQLWRVRPYDSRTIFKRLLPIPKPQGPLIRIFEREVELR